MRREMIKLELSEKFLISNSCIVLLNILIRLRQEMESAEDVATVNTVYAVMETHFIRMRQSATELEHNKLVARNSMFDNVVFEAELVMMRYLLF